MKPPSVKQKLMPELNRLYVSGKCNLKFFSRREMQGYSYIQNGIAQNSGMTSIYRYAQDIDVDGKIVCAMLITKEKDESKVKVWFDEIIKQIKNLPPDIAWGKPTELKFWYE